MTEPISYQKELDVALRGETSFEDALLSYIRRHDFSDDLIAALLVLASDLVRDRERQEARP